MIHLLLVLVHSLTGAWRRRRAEDGVRPTVRLRTTPEEDAIAEAHLRELSRPAGRSETESERITRDGGRYPGT